jgi:hypothetical protein
VTEEEEARETEEEEARAVIRMPGGTPVCVCVCVCVCIALDACQDQKRQRESRKPSLCHASGTRQRQQMIGMPAAVGS